MFGTTILTNSESGFSSWADAFVAKFDAHGQLLRAVQPRGPNDQRAYSIALDPAANIYITGWTQGTNVLFGSLATTNAYLDMFVATIDPDLPVLKIEPGEPAPFGMPGMMLVSWPITQPGSAAPNLESSTNFTTWIPADVLAFMVGNGRDYFIVEKSKDLIFYRLRLSN